MTLWQVLVGDLVRVLSAVVGTTMICIPLAATGLAPPKTLQVFPTAGLRAGQTDWGLGLELWSLDQKEGQNNQSRVAFIICMVESNVIQIGGGCVFHI